MAREFKDVEINGRKFRLNPVSAREGSWIVMLVQTAAAARAAGVGSSLGIAADPEIYGKVQDILLANCCLYVDTSAGSIPQPIFANGVWLKPELQDDVDTVFELAMKAMDFVVGPSMERWKKLEAAPDPSTTNQSPSPTTSAATSGGQ